MQVLLGSTCGKRSTIRTETDVANYVPHGQYGFAIRAFIAMKARTSRFSLEASEPEVLFDAVAVHRDQKLETRLARGRGRASELPIYCRTCRTLSTTFLSWSSPASSTGRSRLSLTSLSGRSRLRGRRAMTKLQAESAADLGRLAEQLRQLGIEIRVKLGNLA